MEVNGKLDASVLRQKRKNNNNNFNFNFNFNLLAYKLNSPEANYKESTWRRQR
jgi:hypothetical protein